MDTLFISIKLNKMVKMMRNIIMYQNFMKNLTLILSKINKTNRYLICQTMN